MQTFEHNCKRFTLFLCATLRNITGTVYFVSCRYYRWLDKCDHVHCGRRKDRGWCNRLFLRSRQRPCWDSDQASGRGAGFCLRDRTDCKRHGQSEQPQVKTLYKSSPPHTRLHRLSALLWFHNVYSILRGGVNCFINTRCTYKSHLLFN